MCGKAVLHGRDVGRGQPIAAELQDHAKLVAGELVEPNTADKLVEGAIAAFGKLDAMINNASWVVRSDIVSSDSSLFDRVRAVNARTPFLLIQAAIGHLKRSRGCVLNIASMNAYSGESNLLAYSVSKSTLKKLSRNLVESLCYNGVRIHHFNVD
ncbi:MAG: SDR family NAD(P)-dependent oxidoreductase [Pirellulales bacterium]|nr:SDR family NAD(P)-dependent oxidoreductase [Pirellulales bacterium]